MTKVCTKCGIEKNVDEFYRDRRTKDCKRSDCKGCISKQRKKYYEKHKVHIAKYRKEHKESLYKQNKEYRNSPVLFNSKSKARKELELYEEVKQSDEGYLMVKCAYCGEWYIPTYSNIKNKVGSINGIKEGDSNLYCSDGCKEACPIFNQHKYPKDFKKDTSNPYYTQAELKVWSDEVLSRANYICEICGNEAVHSHHIEPKKLQPALALDPDNGIAVCKDCHYNKLHVGECSTGALANVACAN